MEKTDESYWPNTYILCRWVKLKQSTTAFTKETVLCFITSISHDYLCPIAGFSRDNLPSSTVCTPWVCSVTAIAFWDSSSGIQTSWFRLCFFCFFASISSLFNYCGHLKVISSTCALHPYQFLGWGKLVSTAPMPVLKRRVASLLRQPHPPVEPAEHPAQALQEQPESALCPPYPKWLRLC